MDDLSCQGCREAPPPESPNWKRASRNWSGSSARRRTCATRPRRAATSACLTGDSQAMKAVRLAVRQVARTDSTVLILGETGTGKELVARAIHQLSPRRDHLLVAVNCAALAPGVIASELFGHEAGRLHRRGPPPRRPLRAGPPRHDLPRRGRRTAAGDPGDAPARSAGADLERVGGSEPLAVDVRVIAATHQDLTAAMSQGTFRADLFFRLNVFPIRVPPLRERRDDIPDLVRHFLHHFGRRLGKTVTDVSPATLALLTAYHWPGNVRELENIVERAMIVTTGDVAGRSALAGTRQQRHARPRAVAGVGRGGAAPPSWTRWSAAAARSTVPAVRGGPGFEADHPLRQNAQAPHRAAGQPANSTTATMLPGRRNHLSLGVKRSMPHRLVALSAQAKAMQCLRATRQKWRVAARSSQKQEACRPESLLPKEEIPWRMSFANPAAIASTRIAWSCARWTASIKTSGMLYIDPDDCIDCGACVPECPVEAIFHEADMPARWAQFVQLNAERAAVLKESGGHIRDKQEPMTGSRCPGQR